MKNISEIIWFKKNLSAVGAEGRLLKVCESETIVVCWSVKFSYPPAPLKKLSSVENEGTAKLTTGEGI
jgi:hypothetical protein